jgi:hypothetical protein
MNDDLEFLRARLPGYHEYGEEEARHDSDMRVRAFVGEHVTDVVARLGTLDEPTQKIVDDVLMLCMFTDQAFIKKVEHAELSAASVAALIHADRSLVEHGERLAACTTLDIGDLLTTIRGQLQHRDVPAPGVAGLSP